MENTNVATCLNLILFLIKLFYLCMPRSINFLLGQTTRERENQTNNLTSFIFNDFIRVFCNASF